MTVSLSWLDESKAELLSSFEGSWTWEEFHQILDDSARLFREGSASVSSMIDFSRSAGLPPGAPFAHARRAFKMYDAQPNYSGIVVVITTRPFTVMLAKILIATGIARSLMIASSRDEALKLLRSRQAKKLSDSKSS